MRMINCTAATLRAVLCYTDSGITPTVAFDKDELAYPLAKKLRDTLGNKGGSQMVAIIFNGSAEEMALLRQFEGVIKEINSIFVQLKEGNYHQDL